MTKLVKINMYILSECCSSSSLAVGFGAVFVGALGLLWILCNHRQKTRCRRERQRIVRRAVEVNEPLLVESHDPSKVNALVIGGSGMLGKEIVNGLLKDGGYKVHSLDIFIPKEENRNSEVCSYIQTDITNLEDLCISTKGMDVVFHTAAILPTVIGAKDSDFDRVIVNGTKNVIAACKKSKVKRLIYTSTADVVISKGILGVDSTTEDHPLPKRPLNAYVAAKGKAEMAVLAANCDEMLTSALRPGGILELVIYPKLDRLVYVGDKHRVFPLVSCNDLAMAHLNLDKLLISNKVLAAGRSFNWSHNISEIELDETIAAEIGDSRETRSVPMFLFKLLTYINVISYWLVGIPPVSPLMTIMALNIIKLKFHSYSCVRAQEELGWRLTPWKETVKRLAREWKSSRKEK